MTRLPPRSREPERTQAVMVLIGSIIRAHLRGGSAPRPRAFDPVGAARSLEAAGISALEPIPDYAELHPQSIAAPSVAMPDEAAAVAPQLTAASLIQSPSFSPSFLLPVKQNGGLADCAAICCVSLDWFTRNVDALMNDRLFPAALPETGQRRWALARIREWATNPISTTPLARARAAHAKTMEKQDAVD